MYSISFDARNERIRLKLDGFWTAEVMRRCRDDLLQMIAHERKRYSYLSVLSDCTTYPVQGPDVTDSWTCLLGKDAGGITQPYAIVVASTLNKLQVQRALNAPNVRAFMDIPEAEKWLNACRSRDLT